MARHDDVSADHFDWLVDARSKNQRSTLALYKIILASEINLSRNVVLRQLSQDLAAVSFSLWRAVFLTDLTADFEKQLADVKKFLQSLIAHNAILYQTDFSAREWTFEYYIENALLRLRTERFLKLGGDGFDLSANTAKERWSKAQIALDTSIEAFAMLLG